MNRPKRNLRCAALAGALLWPAACVAPEADPADREIPAHGHLGADFGNAVSHNTVRHIVDPAPVRASAGAPEMDGVRAAGALRRYRGGTVIVPDKLETTTFGNDNR